MPSICTGIKMEISNVPSFCSIKFQFENELLEYVRQQHIQEKFPDN